MGKIYFHDDALYIDDYNNKCEMIQKNRKYKTRYHEKNNQHSLLTYWMKVGTIKEYLHNEK